MKKNNDISILLSGEAGQGLQTVEKLLARAAKASGYNVFTTSEVMSRVRGGNNSSLVRISSERVKAPVKKIDILVPFGTGAFTRFEKRIGADTFIFSDPAHMPDDFKFNTDNIYRVPFVKLSEGCGGGICINLVILGFIGSITGIKQDLLETLIRKNFSRLDAVSVEKNITALGSGYNEGEKIKGSGKISIEIISSDQPQTEPLLDGNDSIGIGAIAGGCNFISSYPMSPGTGLLLFMARHAEKTGTLVEQAEDEIAAVNMACGAWYAGARAIVTTSGGGFSLMTEGVSLAGCTETPLVIHIGQRPGPATGLPTRTEQGDLNLALYCGHGEFPRIIFAPGDYADGIYLSSMAFNLADKYQAPVFILTDQYFLDSSYNTDKTETSSVPEQNYIIKTEADYKRYLITDSGISPRGVPGYGSGTICLDSDEHDESGYITEDFLMRNSMMEKRQRKLAGIEDEIIPPFIHWGETKKYLLVSWGSTYHAIAEAVRKSGRNDLSMLHYRQIYPLHRQSRSWLDTAEKIILIENNFTGQFGKLIESVTGSAFARKILRYDGSPFTVEDILDEIKLLEK